MQLHRKALDFSYQAKIVKVMEKFRLKPTNMRRGWLHSFQGFYIR
jgi:hypothetical protein